MLVLLDSRGEPLLPLGAVLHFLEIPGRREGSTLTLEWPPPLWRARLDLEGARIETGGSSLGVATGEMVMREGEIYLAVEPLQKLLDTPVRINWQNLHAVFGPRADFPVTVRLENEARRGRAAGGRRQFAGLDDPSVGYPLTSGGLTTGWQVGVRGAGSGMYGTARGTVGTAVLGGSLSAGAGLSSGSGGGRITGPFARYTRLFGERAPLRQLHVGQVSSDALVARAINGVTVSNDPFYAGGYFGEVMVEPVVPAGWEYEIYQGGQLMGVSTPDEPRAIPADLGYGANPVRVRMIGPAGQEQVQELTYLVPTSQVPGGDWRYRAGAGWCRQGSRCSLLAYGDLRYGIDHRSTAGVGLEGANRADSSGWVRPYAMFNHSLRPDLRVELRGQWGALAHASVQRYARGHGWQASAGWSDGSAVSTSARPHWYADASASIVPTKQSRPIVTRVRLHGGDLGTVDSWTASAATTVGAYYLRGSHEHGFQNESVTTLYAGRRIRTASSAPIQDVSLSSDVHLTASGLRQLQLGATGRPLRTASVTTALRWTDRSRVPHLAVSMTTRTPMAYLQSSANRGGSGSSWYASASGGMALDRDHGIVARPLDTQAQTGVGGRVFLDLNGDGVFSEGEEPLAGVSVVVGGARVTTDESGSFRYWGLTPHRVSSVGLDTINLSRPDLTPAGPAQRIRTVPHRFTRLDIPVVRTQELVGRVTWDDGRGLPVGGVTVEARREEGGEVFRAVTFSDGEFYFLRLRPGSYSITVAQSALEALQARAASEPVEIPAGDNGPVRSAAILLTRAPLADEESRP